MKFFSFIFALLFYHVQCGRVLFIPPIISASHKIAMANWADAMAARGHEVYWWAPATELDKYQPKNATYVDHFKVEIEDEISITSNQTDILNVWTTPSDFEMLFLETRFNFLLLPFYESIAKNYKESMDRILSMKFDFVILDEFFNGCGFVVSHFLDAPVGLYVSTCTMTTTSYRFNSVPTSPAYMPPVFNINVLSNQMNFYERMLSTVNWWLSYADDHLLFSVLNYKLQTYFSSAEDFIKQLIPPDFQFICVNQQLELPGPFPQNLIYIGGIQMAATVESLNEEWQSFVESSKKGFILLAFGHWAKWTVAPQIIKDAFIEAFRRIPQDYSIIWQYDDEPFENLPKNIKLSKWLPQRSLLADPNCKLFITHAGCNSLTEAVYHAVPMVAIPLMADQPDGAARMASKGLGILLKKNEITSDSLLKSILKVLKNESYGINVRKFADNLKSDSMSPVEKAVFWSEFAMRNQGGSYYKSSLISSTYIDWIKYYCIDFLIYFCIICYILVRVFVNIISIVWKFTEKEKRKTD